ncbi:LIMR family protein [Scenedesmus sp. PABB004]|nr:LIMR family protein [Scenedesmus sp. PABB004]
MAADERRIAAAIKARAGEFFEQKECVAATLSLKRVRRIVESDLGLEQKSLDEQKDVVARLVDTIVLAQAAAGAKKAGAAGGGKAAKKRPAADVDNDDDGDGGGADEEGEEDEEEARRPAKKKPARAPASAPARRGKGEGAAAAPAPKHGPKVQKLQRICKAAGITVGPALYVKVTRRCTRQHGPAPRAGVPAAAAAAHAAPPPPRRRRRAAQNKGDAAVAAALGALLAKHGLDADSDAGAIGRARARIERNKDLEGIDAGNIIAADGGRPTRRAAAAVNFKAILKKGSDSEEESSEEEEEDASSSGSGSDEELTGSDDDAPAGRKPGGKKRGAGQQKQRKAERGGSDDDDDDKPAPPPKANAGAGAGKKKKAAKPRNGSGSAGSCGPPPGDDDGGASEPDDAEIAREQEAEEEAEAEAQDASEEEESDFEAGGSGNGSVAERPGSGGGAPAPAPPPGSLAQQARLRTPPAQAPLPEAKQVLAVTVAHAAPRAPGQPPGFSLRAEPPAAPALVSAPAAFRAPAPPPAAPLVSAPAAFRAPAPPAVPSLEAPAPRSWTPTKRPGARAGSTPRRAELRSAPRAASGRPRANRRPCSPRAARAAVAGAAAGPVRLTPAEALEREAAELDALHNPSSSPRPRSSSGVGGRGGGEASTAGPAPPPGGGGRALGGGGGSFDRSRHASPAPGGGQPFVAQVNNLMLASGTASPAGSRPSSGSGRDVPASGGIGRLKERLTGGGAGAAGPSGTAVQAFREPEAEAAPPRGGVVVATAAPGAAGGAAASPCAPAATRLLASGHAGSAPRTAAEWQAAFAAASARGDRAGALSLPGPSGGAVQCYVRRVAGPLGVGGSAYELRLEATDELLAVARRRVKSARSSYLISAGPLASAVTRGDAQLLKANLLGSDYLLHGRGGDAGVHGGFGAQLLAVNYQSAGAAAQAAPRCMTAALPVPESRAWSGGAAPTGGPLDDLSACLEAARARELPPAYERDLVMLHTMPTHFDALKQVHYLDFKGRVTRTSLKNFQLVGWDHNANALGSDLVLLFGKRGHGEYAADFSYPVSALQAFALAAQPPHSTRARGAAPPCRRAAPRRDGSPPWPGRCAPALVDPLPSPRGGQMALPEGFNWFLILLTVALSLLLLAVNVYVLVHYQHPDDANQAWFPKGVVVLGLWLAMAMVLLFPLDVANRAACSSALVESSCVFTLPMRQLWQAVFIANLVMTFFFIPFTLFFYEGDSDYSCGLRIKNALLWTAAMALVLGLAIGVAYGLAGYVEYPVQELTSGLLPLDALQRLASFDTRCIVPGQGFAGFAAANATRTTACDAVGGSFVAKTWTLRVSLAVYIMAVQSVMGWVLFLVFAGWGFFAAPLDWLFQYLRRPKTVISKSEFIERARGLAMRAKDIKARAPAGDGRRGPRGGMGGGGLVAGRPSRPPPPPPATQTTADMLKRQEREAGRTRHWRGNLRQLQRQLLELEEDEVVLDSGQDGEVRWVLYQLGYLLTGLMGVVGLAVSGAWLAHIIVYMLPPVFIKLDGVFPLFGVAAFAAFCAYLMAVAIKGNFLLGLNLLVVSLYPIRPGATLMSSFLVNTALILAMAGAVIQFAASAFASYASSTHIFDVFGSQARARAASRRLPSSAAALRTVMFLKGLRYIYQFNIFLYMLMAVMGLSILAMAVRGPGKWKRSKREDAYKF